MVTFDFECQNPNVHVQVLRRGSGYDHHKSVLRILQAVRKAGVKCPIHVNGEMLTDEGDPA